MTEELTPDTTVATLEGLIAFIAITAKTTAQQYDISYADALATTHLGMQLQLSIPPAPMSDEEVAERLTTVTEPQEA